MVVSTKQQPKPLIMIGIPTCMRPGMLKICLQSIGISAMPENAEVRMVVADNDVNQSGRAVVEAFASAAPFPVEYTLCAERGHSNIRNHIFEYAVEMGADYLASSDDDEGPVSPTWLTDLYAAIRTTGADAVGPAHDDEQRRAVKNSPLPSRNLIMSARLYRDLGIRYDSLFNFTGGGDTDFGKCALKAGAKFVADPRCRANAWIVNPALAPARAQGHHQGRWFTLRRHYNRVRVLTYANRVKNGKPAAQIIVDAMFNFVKGIVLLPFAFVSKSQRWRCIKSFIKAIACPMSLFGPGNYEPYRKMDGY